MSQLNIALAVIGTVVLLAGLYANRLKAGIIQAPMIAVAVGLLVGPHGLGWLDIADWGDEFRILEQAARITLAIGLMGVALRLRRSGIWRLWRPVGLLLFLGMAGMWVIAALISGWLLGLSFWLALLLGAVLIPTDPVVASSVVTGPLAEHDLPDTVRETLSFESGANDGLAYPLVTLPLLMLGGTTGQVWEDWALNAVLRDVVATAACGCVLGWVAAKLLALVEQGEEIERASLLGYTVALSLLTLGGARLLGADALISVFCAGIVFRLVATPNQSGKFADVQEAVARLFTLPMFVLFGLALPLDAWERLGWPLLALVVLVLLLRRPPVLALLQPVLRPWLDARQNAFLGWFGPIGISSLFYAVLAEREAGAPVVWHAASAVIAASILVHGATAAPLTRRFARH